MRCTLARPDKDGRRYASVRSGSHAAVSCERTFRYGRAETVSTAHPRPGPKMTDDLESAPRPFSTFSVPSSARIPRSLALLFASTVASGPLAAIAGRKVPLPARILRGILVSAASAWALLTAVDHAEHLRLEKKATGRYLRWSVVPPGESALHLGLLATNTSALLLARPIRRPMGPADLWLLAAPAVFLALGWSDELIFHRKRAPHREHMIHTTEHLAEGVMWAALYAKRLVRWGE